MIRILLIGFLLTLLNSSYGQIDTINFNQPDDWMNDRRLYLNPDKTFRFFNNMGSCWAGGSIQGTWKRANNRIVLTDTIHWQEDNIRMDTSANNKTDYVLLTVKDENGNPLQGIKIRYNLTWVNRRDAYLTDENGQIRISKDYLNRLKNEEHDYSSVYFMIYFSRMDCPECAMSTVIKAAYDKIDITLVGNPKEELVIRTTTYRIHGDHKGSEIYFESQTYTTDIGFGVQNWGNFRTRSVFF